MDVRLDTEGYDWRGARGRRIVRVLRNNAGKELRDLRTIKRLYHTERDWRKGYSLHGCGLTDSRVHRWHGLAILPVMTMRRTPHRVTALHRLFGRSHSDAVERIRRESGDQCRNMDSPSQAHQE
jgi:hypothetical protein